MSASGMCAAATPMTVAPLGCFHVAITGRLSEPNSGIVGTSGVSTSSNFFGAMCDVHWAWRRAGLGWRGNELCAVWWGHLWGPPI